MSDGRRLRIAGPLGLTEEGLIDPKAVSGVPLIFGNAFAWDLDGLNDHAINSTDWAVPSVDLFNDDWSWSGWIKRFAPAVSRRVFESSDETLSNRITLATSGTGVLNLAILVAGVLEVNIVGTSVLPDSSWVLAGIERNKTTGDIRLYVDGVQEGITDNFSAVPSGHTALRYGNFSGGAQWLGRFAQTSFFRGLKGSEFAGWAAAPATNFAAQVGARHSHWWGDDPADSAAAGGKVFDQRGNVNLNSTNMIADDKVADSP